MLFSQAYVLLWRAAACHLSSFMLWQKPQALITAETDTPSFGREPERVRARSRWLNVKGGVQLSCKGLSVHSPYSLSLFLSLFKILSFPKPPPGAGCETISQLKWKGEQKQCCHITVIPISPERPRLLELLGFLLQFLSFTEVNESIIGEMTPSTKPSSPPGLLFSSFLPSSSLIPIEACCLRAKKEEKLHLWTNAGGVWGSAWANDYHTWEIQS